MKLKDKSGISCQRKEDFSILDVQLNKLSEQHRKTISKIIDFIRTNPNVSEKDIAVVLAIDPLWAHLFVKMLWKTGFLKRTRKGGTEWRFSLKQNIVQIHAKGES